ncbi:MAG: hypothetical protein OEV48_15605 [Acidobacteriota bacterium]|nr:hypothetical protein [Acidobacteriota bacterium]
MPAPLKKRSLVGVVLVAVEQPAIGTDYPAPQEGYFQFRAD